MYLSKLLFCLAALARQAPTLPTVPDARTASKIAYLTLARAYGAKRIDQELPLLVELKKGVWHITGTGPVQKPSISGNRLQLTFGGVAYLELDRATCKVLKMIHGK